MKMLFVVAALFVASLANAQKLSSDKVPQPAKDGFKKAHPAATATWEWEDANYEANFKENGKTMSCVINKQGTILETETDLPSSALPVAAKNYVNAHYKGKQWKEVAKIVKANGEVNYEVNVAGTDVLFDAWGNHLQKKETEEDEKD